MFDIKLRIDTQLEVINIQKSKIYTKVVRGGKLKPHQGVNKKGGGLSLKGITEKDKKDLAYAAKLDIDYVAVSFVKDADDIKAVKKVIGKKQIGVIAKIERSEALENIDEIAKASDGLLVARGDLGVEIGIEQLPAVQDMLIRKAISFDKIVIVATQMMESMINNRVPTRAEVFDVANAVTSGVDAVMLSAETAIGNYPIDVIQEVSRICEVAEQTNRKNLKITRKDKSFVNLSDNDKLYIYSLYNRLLHIIYLQLKHPGILPILFVHHPETKKIIEKIFERISYKLPFVDDISVVVIQ